MAEQQKSGSLWSRMMGLKDQTADQAAKPAKADDDDDALTFDEAPTDASPTVKLANVQPPVPAFANNPLDAPVAPAAPAARPAVPVAKPVAAAPTGPCEACGTPRVAGQPYCGDCGYMFPTDAPAVGVLRAAPVAGAPAKSAAVPSLRIKGKYLLGKLVGDKLGVKRYRGLDASQEPHAHVVIVAAPVDDAPPVAEAIPVGDDELLPTFDDELVAAIPETVPMAEIQGMVAWPKPIWEKDLLEKIDNPALPDVIDCFVEKNTEYLILEVPQGQNVWDAWDDPETDAATRYGWLIQLAQAMATFHKAGVIHECLSPDHLVIDGAKKLRIADVGDLLPLPIPVNAPIRGTHYTPPEIILAPEQADARASLYSLGAILYSLEYLHHGLEDKDFESKYVPKQITDRFPDVHPLLPRVLNKTFVKDPLGRFPSDEAGKKDATGISELIYTLQVCQKTFDNVRLDMAAWTTTGMVRTGNEDAFAFLHGVDSRQDELYEYALILLCDGMGGYDAGEVAAALAIAKMKEYFLQQPMFAALTGKETFPAPTDVEATKKMFHDGLRFANKEVHTASKIPGKGKRGMGCTAEAVYVDAKHVFVGHVGDSRVYHLKDGRLLQLTRDQTLVNRLVELGQISEEEAEDHPRKNELQQAIGGQPDVNPGTYHSRLKRGDWVLVCSDGLTNHINNKELEKMLTREANNSAEEAARRLLNLVNLRGATDNATIVVIRAT